jgi:hypothetical protein
LLISGTGIVPEPITEPLFQNTAAEYCITYENLKRELNEVKTDTSTVFKKPQLFKGRFKQLIPVNVNVPLLKIVYCKNVF